MDAARAAANARRTDRERNSLNCDELRPNYGLYALGVLEDPDKTELRAHLARGCADCSTGIREAGHVAYGIGASVAGPEPSRALRNRVLAIAGEFPGRQRTWRAVWLTGAAVAAMAIFATLGYQIQRRDAAIAALQQDVNRSGAQNANLQAALAMLQSPETREVTFGMGAPAPPRGRVFFNARGVLLIASNLPAPPPGKTYEMWIIPKGAKPAPAGLFASNAAGGAFHYFGPAAQVSSSDTIAVTLEVMAGSDAPSSTPLIAVTL
jgi:hypothetical protein